MKKKLTKNLSMRLLSLVIAAILWIVIINVDDPVDTQKFTGIPVKVINEDAVTSQGKVYEITSGSTVDVMVRAKRSILDSLRISDFSAIADLSKLWDVKAVKIDVTIMKPSAQAAEIIGYGKNHTLKVVLEDVKEKGFPVTVVTKGTAADGYYFGELKVKPNIIQVSGAESQIDKIAQVRVEVDISNASEDIVEKVVPQAYDEAGKLLDSEKLEFSVETIKVTAPMYPTKYVPLKITTSGEPYSGYAYAGMDYEPKSILVAGSEDVLKKINSIDIDVNIANLSSSLEESISISEYLPAGIVIAGDSPTVMVNITIEKIQTKEIVFYPEDIQPRNLPAGARFNYDDNKSITAEVSGLQKLIAGLTKENLQPYINLEGLSYGEHMLEIEFEAVDSNIVIAALPKIKIILSEVNNTDTPAETPVPSTDDNHATQKPAEPTATPEYNLPEETE